MASSDTTYRVLARVVNRWGQRGTIIARVDEPGAIEGYWVVRWDVTTMEVGYMDSQMRDFIWVTDDE